MRIENILERLRQFYNVENNRQLSSLISVNYNTIATWIKRDKTPYELLDTITQNENISFDWLLNGEGSMFKDNKKDRDSIREVQGEYIYDSPAKEEGTFGEYLMVPKYNVKASAGGGSLIHREDIVDHLAFKRSWLNGLSLNVNSVCLIEARGDSMEPVIKNGDLLLIDTKQVELKNGIYVIDFNNQLFVKRIQRKLDGTIVIKSDNPIYEAETLPPDQEHSIRLIGQVVWYGRAIA